MKDLKYGPLKLMEDFVNFAIRGANAGMEFGLSDGVDLRLINDFDWLRQRFHMDEMNDTI